jgi:hypothetical protein
MISNDNRSGKATGVNEKEPRRSDVRSGSSREIPKTVIRAKSRAKIIVKDGRLRVIEN